MNTRDGAQELCVKTGKLQGFTACHRLNDPFDNVLHGKHTKSNKAPGLVVFFCLVYIENDRMMEPGNV